MTEETQEKIETGIFAAALISWGGISLVPEGIKQHWFGQVDILNQLAWGGLMIASLLFMLLRKIIALKRQRRTLEVFSTFTDGIKVALSSRRDASLDVFALSTQTFLHYINEEERFRLGRVRVLLPTRKALEAFYSTHALEMGLKEDAPVNFIVNQIEESIETWKELQQDQKIKQVNIRRIELFPSAFIALIDGDTAFTGSYLLKTNKNPHRHGIKLTQSFIYSGNYGPVPNFRQWFDSAWEVAGGT